MELEFSDGDLLNGDNLLARRLQRQIIKEVTQGHYHVVLASPPCSTFSWARWANKWGPRPLRSASHPFGFRTLSPARRRSAENANKMIAFTVKVLNIQLDSGKALKKGVQSRERSIKRRQCTSADQERF